MSQKLQPELFNDTFLVQRLSALGLSGVQSIESHQNRAVMVSVTPRGVLRIHRGYAYAPDSVLAAIVTFVKPGTKRQTRRAAQDVILRFPVDAFAPSPRVRRRKRSGRPEDRPLLRKLSLLHSQLNEQFFDGKLQQIVLRLSRRMQRRLGELMLDASDVPVEIALSYRHVTRDGWHEVEQTMLHEMIHQWQAETARPVDHGAIFRRKAREVGITPRAMRDVGHTPPYHED
jgi:hypothetical protein